MAGEELSVLTRFFDRIVHAATDAGDELTALQKGTPDPVEPDPKPNPDPVKPDPVEPDPVAPSSKRFFLVARHNGMPANPAGLEPLDLAYEGSFFNEGRIRTNAGYSVQDVSRNKVIEAAKAAPLLSCPDIERWAHKDTWRVPEENVQRYLEFCELYRDNLPSSDHQFGLYSILPVRNYFHAVGEKDFAEWQGWNDEVTRIADHADVLFPSIYTFSSVFEGSADAITDWQDYAIANINEAKRIAPGKPVYPFLWPWYHPSARTPIDGFFWTIQMETCEEHADGFVIWDDLSSARTGWAEVQQMSWWKATEDFMRGR